MKVDESIEVSIDDLNRRGDVVEMITVAVGLTVVAVCLFWL